MVWCNTVIGHPWTGVVPEISKNNIYIAGGRASGQGWRHKLRYILVPRPFFMRYTRIEKKKAWFQLSAHASDFNRIPLNRNLSSILQYITQ